MPEVRADKADKTDRADRVSKARKAAPRKAATKKTTKRVARKKAPAAGQAMLRVKQVRSGIDHAETYRRTLRALGIRHHQQVVTVADSPSTRGALHKVRHLVEVAPVQEA